MQTTMYATIILKSIVCLILLIVYFVVFGNKSLKKYFKEGVIIERFVYEAEYLYPPGYLI